jgi:hypothetical protein
MGDRDRHKRVAGFIAMAQIFTAGRCFIEPKIMGGMAGTLARMANMAKVLLS